MGKYSTLEQNDLEKLTSHGIIAIANELAEANRLKRLELRQIDDRVWNEATSQKLTKKELEDQA